MSNFDEYMMYFIQSCHDLNTNPKYQDIYNGMVKIIKSTKEIGGRMFIIGMGGSAANAQHMANDFRKIGGIDAICLSDNIAELTARANDDGLDTIYNQSMKVSNFTWKDILFVLSVSGGNEDKNASLALVNAVRYAKGIGGTILGIVGMPDSYTKKYGDYVLVTPQPPKYITQIAESLQPVIWHGLVSDEQIMVQKAKW